MIEFQTMRKVSAEQKMCPVLGRHFCMSLAEVKHNLVRSKRNWRRCNRRRCGFWHLSSVKIRVGLAAPEPLNLMNDDIRKEGLKKIMDPMQQITWINGSMDPIT